MASYDTLGRLTSSTPPGQSATSFDHNCAGDINKTTLPDGRQIVVHLSALLPALLLAGLRQWPRQRALSRLLVCVSSTWLLGLLIVKTQVMHYLLGLTTFSALLIPVWLEKEGRGPAILAQAFVAVLCGFGYISVGLGLSINLGLALLPAYRKVDAALFYQGAVAMIILATVFLDFGFWAHPPDPNKEYARAALERPAESAWEGLQVDANVITGSLRFYGGYRLVAQGSEPAGSSRLVRSGTSLEILRSISLQGNR